MRSGIYQQHYRSQWFLSTRPNTFGQMRQHFDNDCFRPTIRQWVDTLFLRALSSSPVLSVSDRGGTPRVAYILQQAVLLRHPCYLTQNLLGCVRSLASPKRILCLAPMSVGIGKSTSDVVSDDQFGEQTPSQYRRIRSYNVINFVHVLFKTLRHVIRPTYMDNIATIRSNIQK